MAAASETATLKGQFLIAMPALADPNFFQTVTCLAEHNEAGALGIVVNRCHDDLTARDIFEELKLAYTPSVGSIPIHVGGPVHQGEIFILHGPPFTWEGCLPVTPEVAMSNTLDLLEAIGQERGPRSFLIALGCAGWARGQLEWEIKENAWLTVPVVREIVFDIPLHDRWQEAVKKMGIDPMLLSGKAGHA